LRAVDEDSTGGSWVVLDPVAGVAATCASAEGLALVPGARQPGALCWALRCALPEPVAPELVLGWHDEPLPIDLARRVTLWQIDPDETSAECLAQGRLMPWGEGRALWIDAVRGEHPIDIV
jgi:hypothetical protein